MEEEETLNLTSPSAPPKPPKLFNFDNFNKNNWPWISGAVVTIIILFYFLLTNLSAFNLSAAIENSQKTLSQNSSQPISSINNAIQTTNIDILLNQLDIAESDLTQALNDTPIDVMSDE